MTQLTHWNFWFGLDFGAARLELERKFLSAPPEPAVEHIQRVWDLPIDQSMLLDAALSTPSRDLLLERDPATGEHVGFREVLLSASAANGSGAQQADNKALNAKNSTSLLRAPAKLSEATRGTTTSYPFTPGGFVASPAAAFEKQQQTVAEALGDIGMTKTLRFVAVVTF